MLRYIANLFRRPSLNTVIASKRDEALRRLVEERLAVEYHLSMCQYYERAIASLDKSKV